MKILLLLLLSFTASAADLNGYTSTYEVNIGAAPACDQTITTATTPTNNWSAIVFTNTVICIDKGDHTGRGTLTITASGTSGTPKWLRYTRSGDNDDEPWDQTSANQAVVKKIIMSGADYWRIHRLTFQGGGAAGSAPVIDFTSSGAATNNVLNRLLIEDYQSTGASGVIFLRDSNTDNTIQNSVLRDMSPKYGVETNCFELRVGANNNHIVNNEIYDCSKAVYVNSSNTTVSGMVIENNDIYVTSARYTDCSGTTTSGDASSPCARSKSLISNKGGGTSANPNLIIHNRLWGHRVTDRTNPTGCCLSTGDGSAVTYSNDTAGHLSARWVKFQDNILQNLQKGFNVPRSGPTRISSNGNIIYDIQQFNTGSNSFGMNIRKLTDSEWYLNTLVEVVEGWTNIEGAAKNDMRCNVIVNSGAAITAGPAADTQVDYNAFYGTTVYTLNGSGTNKDFSTSTNWAATTAYSLNDIRYPVTENNHLYQIVVAGTTAGSEPTWPTRMGSYVVDGTTVWQAIAGPYKYWRKLLTTPEQITIPYGSWLSTAPHMSWCPSGSETNSLGSRTSIGINDDKLPSGIFATDLDGNSR